LTKRGRAFLALCAVSAATVAAYIYYAKSRTAGSAAEPVATAVSSPTETPAVVVPETTAATSAVSLPEVVSEAPAKPAASEPSVTNVPAPVADAPKPKKPTDKIDQPKRVFFRYNGVDSHYGKLAYVEPSQSMTPRFVDELSCEVAYVASDRGICLSARRGVVTTYTARLFDATTFKTTGQLALGGVPSRTRVSRDGKVAAFTVFVSGHGYSTLDFSTQTLLIDAATGAVLADVEKFTVTRDGEPFSSVDFNFWGVTFTPDTRHFYATLSTGGKHYLVRGDIATNTATVIHSNVECPSVSPDATRIAYKKRFIIDNRIVWELHVLDLATGKETPLSEKRSIDDQLEWLDNEHVLYSVPETADDTSPSTSVWVARADGRMEPRLYLSKAYSPAAVR
jgi:hypothetical protein